MIKDQKIKLNGVDIPNIREVSVKIDTPSDSRGIYREPTFAVIITIVRDASDNAITDLFGIATNTDGRKNIITSGSLEFMSDDTQEFYSFDLKKYFVSNWTLNNPPQPNAPTLESVELRVGSIEFKAGGGGASFELIHFK
jgi:hypothetical protein